MNSAADSSTAAGSAANSHADLIHRFQTVLPDVSVARAGELLDACSGNVEAAIELCLQTSTTPAAPSADASMLSAAVPTRRPKATARSRSLIASQRIDLSGDDATEAESKEEGVQHANMKKRRATDVSAATAAASPSKKHKPKSDAHQPSMSAFFVRSPAKGSAATAAAAASASAIAAAPTPPAAASAAASTSSHPLMSLNSQSSVDHHSTDSDPLKPCFKPGQPVPFNFLSRIYHLIEGENGRIKIINYLTYLFFQILTYTPTDLGPALFLSSDQLAPSFENHQIGVGGSMLIKLVSEMTGASTSKLAADHARLGDLGLIAAQYRMLQSLLFKPAPLSVANVFNTFYALKDQSKRDRKESSLRKLFGAARENELTYLIRIAEGGLRIGSVITTVLTSLARAFVLNHLFTARVAESARAEACSFERVEKCMDATRGSAAKVTGAFSLLPPATAPLSLSEILRLLPSHVAQATAKLKRAYAECPSFNVLLPILTSSPTAIYSLDQHIRLTAGIPVKPQLGRPLTSIVQVLKLFRGKPLSIEVKYDGLRAQIHRMKDGNYRIFSRHLMDQGDRWADLTPFIESAIRQPSKTTEFILDAEIVAIEHEVAAPTDGDASPALPTYRILPFQQLSTRKKKGDSSSSSALPAAASSSKRVEVSCMIYVFDFLSLNGDSLLLRSLPARRELMTQTFEETSGRFQFVEHVDIPASATADVNLEELDEDEPQPNASKLKAKKKPAAAEEEHTSSDDDQDEDGIIDVDQADVEMVDSSAAAASVSTSDEASNLSAAAAASSSSTAVIPSSSAAPSASLLIENFLNSVAIKRGEGIMAKSLSANSTYEPDVRTDQWAKLKKDYISGFGVADSIDVVIIGAWMGNGRKAGFYSPFLAAVYNSETEELESFAKIMSGFTDEMYRQFTDECSKFIIPAPLKYYRVSDALVPPIWFAPTKVWEIRGADFTISPVHSAARGLVHESKGISLRFPRFIRDRTDEKAMEQATTSEQIAEMYRGQSATMKPAGFKPR